MSIHERDLEDHATRALHKVLAGEEPDASDINALTGDVRVCLDALVEVLRSNGVQAARSAFTALVKNQRPWLRRLATQPSSAASESLSQGSEAEATEEPRYQLHRLSYFKNLPKREWNVEDIIRDKGSSVFFGDGGSGKSVVVLSMMLHKAYGLDWIGPRKVKQGLVVWVAAEGEDEIYPRAYAWMLQHGIQEEPNILYVDEIVALNNQAEVNLFIERVQQQLREANITEPITSIVIDTYAECSPGADENNTQDAKVLSAALHHIRKTFDTHVAVIHHTNSSGKMRGSTVLRDYVNTAIKVSEDNGVITLHCDKQRGAPKFKDIRLKIISQLLSDDDLGDSAPVIVADGSPDNKKEDEINEIQQAMLEILSTHQRLSSSDFLRKCKSCEIEGKHISDIAFYRQVKDLVEQGRILKETTDTATKKSSKVWYSLPTKN